MRRLTSVALCLGMAFSLAGPSLADETTVWRLFVADHTEPRVKAIDLPSGETVGDFTLAGPAALYVTGSGRGVFAVQSAANRVSAILSGIAIDDHGDHGDIEVVAPALVDIAIEGERPVHFVEHEGSIALFFDGEGRADLVSETNWLDGRVEARSFGSAAPHHGVAAALDGAFLITAPNPVDPSALPIGINLLDTSGALQGEFYACADLHGEASSGHTLAIACATGLLLVDGDTSGPRSGTSPIPTTCRTGSRLRCSVASA